MVTAVLPVTLLAEGQQMRCILSASRSPRSPQEIPQRTDHGVASALQYVGVDLGGAQVFVTQLFLHGADIHAPFQQVGGEAVATGITTLPINRDAITFTILITPTTANRLSSFVVCVAKVTKLSS